MDNKSSSVNNDYTPSYQENMFWQKNKKIILTIMLIVLAFLCILSFPKSPHSSPENTLDAFVDAINNRDAEKLYTIAADVLHYSNTKEDYIDYLQGIDEQIGKEGKIYIDTVQFENVEDYTAGVDVRAVGTFSIKSPNGIENIKFRLCFSKINGKWYWED